MIGIHHRKGSFSDKWVEWCDDHGVPYRMVDAYSSKIVADLKGCAGFMWHWSHDYHADQLFARQLTLAIESAGIKVFPSVRTAWHFDDKVGQKYLLEAMGIPHVPTYVFYSQSEAVRWLDHAVFPLVFKLRGGAGSMNVRLVKTLADAKRLVRRSFGAGFPVVDMWGAASQALWEYRRDQDKTHLLRAAWRGMKAAVGWVPPASRLRERQRGYAYFQEFVPHNEYDDRLVVIGQRCFCLRRECRENDFRASGSGLISYDHRMFPDQSVDLAFEVAGRMQSQCLALDLVYRHNGQPVVIEVSYGFATGSVYEDCDGYFAPDLTWRNEQVRPESFMIEDFARDCGLFAPRSDRQA